MANGCAAPAAGVVGAGPGVLITRPEPDATRTAALLAARGITAVIAPLLEISPRPVLLPWDVQALLVTSGHAVDVLSPSDMPLLAVGDATAARARARGFRHVESAGGDAAALTSLITLRCDPKAGPLLLASGRGQGRELAAALRSHGFRVLRRSVYAASPVRRLPATALSALQQRRLRAALFLSAETARCFVRVLPEDLRPALDGVEALAIGEAAAAALHGLPWRRIRAAPHPTLDDLLALL